MKKYHLDPNEKHPLAGYDHLRRIVADRPIPSLQVARGDKGGWVRAEENLDHAGDCWISNQAIVTDGAVVKDNAHIKDCAILSDESEASEDCVVGGASQIRERAKICGQAVVGHSFERNTGLLKPSLYQRALKEKIIDKVEMETSYDAVVVREHAVISGQSSVKGDVVIKGAAQIDGRARVEGTTSLVVIGGSAHLTGTVRAYGEALVLSGKHDSGQIRS